MRSLRISTRADGRPPGSTVDSVSACGSITPASIASDSQAVNSSSGSGGALDGSNAGNGPASDGRPRSRSATVMSPRIGVDLGGLHRLAKNGTGLQPEIGHRGGGDLAEHRGRADT